MSDSHEGTERGVLSRTGEMCGPFCNEDTAFVIVEEKARENDLEHVVRN